MVQGVLSMQQELELVRVARRRICLTANTLGWTLTEFENEQARTPQMHRQFQVPLAGGLLSQT